MVLVFAGLSFLGGRVEAVLPEPHSGDAPILAATSSLQDETAPVGQSGNEHDGSTNREFPGHSGTHVDHCAHSHLADQPELAPSFAAVYGGGLPAGGILRLVGFESPPQIRPPIL